MKARGEEPALADSLPSANKAATDADEPLTDEARRDRFLDGLAVAMSLFLRISTLLRVLKTLSISEFFLGDHLEPSTGRSYLTTIAEFRNGFVYVIY